MTERMRRVIALGEWHAEWVAKWAADCHPDHHLRDVLLDAPAEARREFYERGDRILGAKSGQQILGAKSGQHGVENPDGAGLV